ncbi:hypothetical protein [Azospirillum sp. TSO22-1]|uniref:hypothetical protein n=1 Tax=Azospirillum sp. TSO22-1 TaxID=716789 RepID=UPI000D6036D4|nr:hypothetical protein [Azospirillum sp. TSO22-1]PWC35718.1 hypothetical protein TSO221_29010 [Azospirillum sp. TSO22-1]
MNNPDLFVDGVLNVTLVKGMIRLDLFSLSATEYRDGQPQPEFRQRLVMSPQTLVALQQELQAAIVALRERGLIPMMPSSGGPQVPTPLSAQSVTPPKPAAGSDASGPEPREGPAEDPAAASQPAAEPQPPSPPRPPRSRNFPSTLGA